MAPGGTGKKIKWTEEEDQQLRDLVAKHGTKKWSYLSTLFHNKGSKQCRRRWQNKLSMDAKSTSWTNEEDAILLKSHKRLGNRWTEIAKQLSGRTDNAVKNRFFALRKKKLRVGGAKRGARNDSGAKGKITSTLSLDKPLAGLQRKGSSGIKSHLAGGLSIDIPGQGDGQSPGKTFAINLPKTGLTREDLCLIDEVNLLNTPLQIAVQDAMNNSAPGSGSDGSKGGNNSTSMSRFREFMNWVFAPEESLLSARAGSMRHGEQRTPNALTPLFASDFNFAIIPESVRSVTRHLLTKQFAHIWTPKVGGSFDTSSCGGGSGGTDTKPSTPSLVGAGLTPISLRRSPRLLGQNSNMDFVGMKVPSPTFSDKELDVLLSCMSPTTNSTKK
ncbi:transcriptional activator Myb [Chloropicon primus]|uniref:Transcriptional activator Myb n=1 Tax=Chloropicon primus TaxID=1764295 RepID=A0A5B8MPZ8_9CHLO|nr:transcriptional activator Myb [Chloropicon primus]UPR01738.1 transcriptional activator Myb [Chloropicon primus]|eukprot:QDZ22517.1 transcriptional activator Myb [Chloropicon primus]